MSLAGRARGWRWGIVPRRDAQLGSLHELEAEVEAIALVAVGDRIVWFRALQPPIAPGQMAVGEVEVIFVDSRGREQVVDHMGGEYVSDAEAVETLQFAAD